MSNLVNKFADLSTLEQSEVIDSIRGGCGMFGLCFAFNKYLVENNCIQFLNKRYYVRHFKDETDVFNLIAKGIDFGLSKEEAFKIQRLLNLNHVGKIYEMIGTLEHFLHMKCILTYPVRHGDDKSAHSYDSAGVDVSKYDASVPDVYDRLLTELFRTLTK